MLKSDRGNGMKGKHRPLKKMRKKGKQQKSKRLLNNGKNSKLRDHVEQVKVQKTYVTKHS